MSSNIGTNFSYRSKEFLDDRQGMADSVRDLKNWSTPVPEGFEVCLKGVWYYYDSTQNLPETGHWIPSVSKSIDDVVDNQKQTVSAEVVEKIVGDIKEITDEVTDLNDFSSPLSASEIVAGPAYTTELGVNTDRYSTTNAVKSSIAYDVYDKELDINNDGLVNTNDLALWESFFDKILSSLKYNPAGTSRIYTLEVGSSILPKIEWKIIRPEVRWEIVNGDIVWKLVENSNKRYITPDSSEVVGETEGTLTGTSWTSRTILTSTDKETFVYTIRSKVGDKVVEDTAEFRFGYDIYTGSGSIDLWNLDELKSDVDLVDFSKRFTESGVLEKTSFDCTGGAYPYILVPLEYFDSKLKTYVSGNLNSDFLTKRVRLVNDMGVMINYMMYRANYIQTGSNIDIEIK